MAPAKQDRQDLVDSGKGRVNSRDESSSATTGGAIGKTAEGRRLEEKGENREGETWPGIIERRGAKEFKRMPVQQRCALTLFLSSWVLLRIQYVVHARQLSEGNNRCGIRRKIKKGVAQAPWHLRSMDTFSSLLYRCDCLSYHKQEGYGRRRKNAYDCQSLGRSIDSMLGPACYREGSFWAEFKGSGLSSDIIFK